MSENQLEYYATPGLMTDPHRHSVMFDGLPTDIAALCRVVQGVMIHIFWAERYGVKLSDGQKQQVQLRSVARKLRVIHEIDNRPLTAERSLGKKLVGNCRDFSTMLTAILRHQGVPARARCGFGRYFLPNHYEDHWVCEYWSATLKRWVLVDAQLDPFQCEQLEIQFDPLDVPRDQFIVGGKAWQICRSGQADPNCFGIFHMRGLWFVRGDFGRDIASLNKTELLPWDGWGIVDRADKDITEDDNRSLDRVAELTRGAEIAFEDVRTIYESDPHFRVPAEISTYLDNGEQKIDLAKEIED